MRLLHTSDWHIGKKLDQFSRLDEQRVVLDEICRLADEHAVDVVLLAGDLFDTFNPSAEAVDLFYKTLKRLSNQGKRPIIAIAGNHDSPERIDAPDPLARECGILFVGFPNATLQPFELDSGVKLIRSQPGFVELSLPDVAYPLRILITPYANELRLKSYLCSEDPEKELRDALAEDWANTTRSCCDSKGVNILISHLFVAKSGEPLQDEPEEEKPIVHVGGAQIIFSDLIPPEIQYTALGHLHRGQLVDDRISPVVYSGSPLAYSFAEANQEKHVVLIDIEPAEKAIFNTVNLNSARKLLRKKANSVEEAADWLRQHGEALVELTLHTTEYLTAEERKYLHQLHPGIISIIPEVEIESNEEQGRPSVDLSKGMEELFEEYFFSVTGQKPNERIKDLFKEIIAREETE